MTASSKQSVWEQPEWQARANQWIHDTLAQQAVTILGPIDPFHKRPWSTVMRIPTNIGDVYFKAGAPVFGHEAAITQAMFRWRPDCTPQVLGVNASTGWMLLADGGQRVREAFGEERTIHDWEAILAAYADLQIELAGHVAELLAMGTRDRRLALLPGLYAALLADTEWLFIDQPDGLTSAEYQRLVDAVPQVAVMCRALAEYAVPESLHHNDLHDGNVLIKNGRYQFFDWGDSSIAHPFFSLRTVFVSAEYTFELDEGDPVFDDLARAYLARWTRFLTEDDLWTAYKLARQLWALSTAVKYSTFLHQIEDESFRTDYGTAVAGSLQEFLAANPSL